MTGIIMDAVLMLLLVAAIGYGVRLERKLAALRAGQLAFAGAVTELNSAAGRAEAALATLRASGQETDLLHDRIIKARQVKQELEALIARGPQTPSRTVEAVATPSPPVASVQIDDERERRMAVLAERIQGLSGPATTSKTTRDAPAGTGRDGVAAIIQALTANQTAKRSLNAARRSLDDDLFAA